MCSFFQTFKLQMMVLENRTNLNLTALGPKKMTYFECVDKCATVNHSVTGVQHIPECCFSEGHILSVCCPVFFKALRCKWLFSGELGN